MIGDVIYIIGDEYDRRKREKNWECQLAVLTV